MAGDDLPGLSQPAEAGRAAWELVPRAALPGLASCARLPMHVRSVRPRVTVGILGFLLTRPAPVPRKRHSCGIMRARVVGLASRLTAMAMPWARCSTRAAVRWGQDTA